MTLEDVLAAAEARIRRYTPEEAHTAAAHGARIVDIRSSDARERHGAVSGGRHVPRTVLEWRVASSEWANPELIGKRLILICEHGLSSVLAASALVDLGVDAGDIVGGFEGWRAAGLPTTGPTRFEGMPGMGPPTRPYGVPGASLVSWRGLPSRLARR
ncbi:MAG TPA: rhodanese-like domain-containing protein [Gaiellaceae bacterium]|nr:rhodanese-like domain-containing protein [Gaiellaceae bacterium]